MQPPVDASLFPHHQCEHLAAMDEACCAGEGGQDQRSEAVDELPDKYFLDRPELEWLRPERVAARRAFFGINEGSAALAFLESCEFISLGTNYQVAGALQAFGVKRLTYPFDWVQSPLSGIIHLLKTDFEDFLTCTELRNGSDVGEKITYTRARWGGSFWHHDVESTEVRDAFNRSIKRFLAKTDEVPTSKPRVFVRLVSSTIELELTMQLHQVLKEQLPACRIYLLMIADFQQVEETIVLPDADVLLYRVHEHIFLETKAFSRSACCENYARALGCAIGLWCRCPRFAESNAVVAKEANLSQAIARFDQMDSGDPGSTGYWPRRFRGQRMNLQLPQKMSGLFGSSEQFTLPNDVSKGNLLAFNAFGLQGIHIKLTDDAVAGQNIRLNRAANGNITAFLLTVATVAASSAVLAAVDGSVCADVPVPEQQS